MDFYTTVVHAGTFILYNIIDLCCVDIMDQWELMI